MQTFHSMLRTSFATAARPGAGPEASAVPDSTLPAMRRRALKLAATAAAAGFGALLLAASPAGGVVSPEADAGRAEQDELLLRQINRFAMRPGATVSLVAPPSTRPVEPAAAWLPPGIVPSLVTDPEQWLAQHQARLIDECPLAAQNHQPAEVVVPPAAIPVPASTTPVTEPVPVEEPADDTTQLVPADQLSDGRLRITVNDSRIVRTSRPFHRVSIASPEVADVTPLGPDTLLVSTRSPGMTQLVLWDELDQSQALFVQSTADLREVQEKLDLLLPGVGIEAVDLRGTIALRGRARSLETAEKAAAIAAAYGEVANFIEITGNQQVALEIRFAEVSRSAGTQLGLNIGLVGQDGSAASNVGNVNPFRPGLTDGGNIDVTNLSVGENVSPNVTLFGGGVIGDVAFEAFLSALRESNLLRVLAEPNLTLISGQQGEFLAGGRIPVPVPQEQGIAIEYEDFGIRLRAFPVVLGDGRIRVRVEPEVSDLDYSNGVTVAGVSVPGFSVRRLSTEVELREGQTFALAGLLSSNVVANKQVTPLLGDVPILGALFRSTRYQRRETELVVLITPRLVSPLDPDEVPPLPGENWKHPNEIELFLLGQMGGEAGVGRPHAADVGGADDAATKADPGPRLEATYTYLPAEPAVR